MPSNAKAKRLSQVFVLQAATHDSRTDVQSVPVIDSVSAPPTSGGMVTVFGASFGRKDATVSGYISLSGHVQSANSVVTTKRWT